MKLLLITLYWFEGFLMAMAASCALAFSICALLALVRIPDRRNNVGLVVVYSSCAALCILCIWGGFFFAGWVGDRTNYVGQRALIWGACFPGILTLAVIPQFLAVARQQTRGIEVS